MCPRPLSPGELLSLCQRGGVARSGYHGHLCPAGEAPGSKAQRWEARVAAVGLARPFLVHGLSLVLEHTPSRLQASSLGRPPSPDSDGTMLCPVVKSCGAQCGSGLRPGAWHHPASSGHCPPGPTPSLGASGASWAMSPPAAAGPWGVSLPSLRVLAPPPFQRHVSEDAGSDPGEVRGWAAKESPFGTWPGGRTRRRDSSGQRAPRAPPPPNSALS